MYALSGSYGRIDCRNNLDDVNEDNDTQVGKITIEFRVGQDLISPKNNTYRPPERNRIKEKDKQLRY